MILHMVKSPFRLECLGALAAPFGSVVFECFSLCEVMDKDLLSKEYNLKNCSKGFTPAKHDTTQAQKYLQNIQVQNLGLSTFQWNVWVFFLSCHAQNAP